MLILTLSQRVTQVVDDGAQVGPRREPLLEPLEQGPTIPALVHQPVPVRRANDDRGRLGRVALLEPAALLPEPCARLATEPLRLGLLERFLHLQHLFQELPRRLRGSRDGAPATARRNAAAGLPRPPRACGAARTP